MPLIQPKSSVSSDMGALQPGSSYTQPFDLLGACHERVQRSLDLLERLLAHVQEEGCDAAARSACADVLRYFEQAAPLHHQDEELHVFPALEAGGDARLREACNTLREQHREMAAVWQQLRLALHELAALPDGPPEARLLQDLTPAVARFVALHDAHLRTEDRLVFPAAAAVLAEEAQAVMGREMASRRGLTL